MIARDLHDRLIAAGYTDPASYLRTKVIDEGLGPGQLAKELSWTEGEVRALLIAHRWHLALARQTQRIGRFLVTAYPAIALNAMVQIMAVLAGFALASAWQARQDALRDTREQLSVLTILADEIATMSTQALGASRPRQQDDPCVMLQKLFTKRWRALSEDGRVLVLGSLERQIREVYDDVDGLAAVSTEFSQEKCKGEAKSLRDRLEQLSGAMELRGRQLEEQHSLLIASQSRDDELRQIQDQLNVLEPLGNEIGALEKTAFERSGAAQCTIGGLETPQWRRLGRGDNAVMLGTLRREVEGAYRVVAEVAALPNGSINEVQCREALTRMKGRLEDVRKSLAARIDELTERRTSLNRAQTTDLPTIIRQAQTSGLLRFLGAILKWAIATLLIIPAGIYGASYGVMFLAARTTR